MTPRVPQMLLSMALDALPAQLRVLRSAKAELGDYVWAFFDGRVVPGRALAFAQLVERGVERDVARRRVEDAIKRARAQGSVFSLGVMTTRDGFPSLLAELAGDRAGVEAIRAWTAEAVKPGWFRLAVVAGAATQLQLVRLDSLPR